MKKKFKKIKIKKHPQNLLIIQFFFFINFKLFTLTFYEIFIITQQVTNKGVK